MKYKPSYPVTSQYTWHQVRGTGSWLQDTSTQGDVLSLEQWECREGVTWRMLGPGQWRYLWELPCCPFVKVQLSLKCWLCKEQGGLLKSLLWVAAGCRDGAEWSANQPPLNSLRHVADCIVVSWVLAGQCHWSCAHARGLWHMVIVCPS